MARTIKRRMLAIIVVAAAMVIAATIARAAPLAPASPPKRCGAGSVHAAPSGDLPASTTRVRGTRSDPSRHAGARRGCER